MLSLIRRLFRRVPPHLAGRMPVDAGVGVARDDYRIGYGPKIRPVVLTTRGDLTTKPRAFAPAPLLPSGARPDWAVRESVGCDCTGAPHQREDGCPPPDASEIVLRTWFAARVDRPTPAENAKRYTREDGTW